MMSEVGKEIHLQSGDSAPAFAPLRPLLQPHERDVAAGMRRLSAALGDFGTPVRLHLQVLVEGAVDHWDIESGKGEPAANRRPPERADVMVVLRQETWIRIAQGGLSPFDALFAGRLRVGGDTELAKRVVRHLSDTTVQFVPPCGGP